MKALNIMLHIMFPLNIVLSLCNKRYDVVLWEVMTWLTYWEYTKKADRVKRIDECWARTIDLNFKQLDFITELMGKLSAARKELKELKEKEDVK